MILGVWEFECPVLGVGNSQTYGITDLPVLRTWCLFKELDFLVETESFQLASFRMRRRRNIPVCPYQMSFCGTTVLWFTDTGTRQLRSIPAGSD